MKRVLPTSSSVVLEQQTSVKRSRRGAEHTNRQDRNTSGPTNATTLRVAKVIKTEEKTEMVEPTSNDATASLGSDSPRVFVGTSGYSYPDWHQKGRFYPEGISAKADLEYYATQFNMVELNYPFYGFPTEATVQKWRQRIHATHPNFMFPAKANKFFTHIKRLNVDQQFIDRWHLFYQILSHLGPEHLGPILFQFDAKFEMNKQDSKTGVIGGTLARLRALGKVLPRSTRNGARFAFEFRHPSWFCPEVYEIFKENDWCLCIVDITNKGHWAGSMPTGTTPDPDMAFPLCSWGVYLRFHGSTGKYEGVYGPHKLKRWVDEHIAKWVASGRDVYVAFNNTDAKKPPAAVQDARTLTGLAQQKGWIVKTEGKSK